MSDINTTSINDLPTDPSIGSNVNLIINETSPSSNPLSLDQSTISQIVNGLQQASLAGATTLPSRDIPLTTEHLTKDVEVQPNYVPPPHVKDYINDIDDDINNYYKSEKVENSLDNIYDEIQAPLLLSILYFLFQLPFFKRAILKYLPFLCHLDGNYNFNGLLFVCALFGFIYYSLSKTVRHFSRF